MKALSVKKIKIFQKLADEFLSKRGQRIESFSDREVAYKVETRYGQLRVCFFAPDQTWGKDYFYSVYSRFADPAIAYKAVDCNPHSGKWNYLGDAVQEPEEAAEDFFQHIGLVLPQGW
jgi:hypothetical protein